jgi:plastocyanin
MKLRLSSAFLVVAAVIGSGCSSSVSSSSTPEAGSGDILSSTTAGGATTWQVKWFNNIADENNGNGQLLTVHKGDSVIWVSTDNQMHTVSPPIGSTAPSPFTANSNTVFTTQSPPISFPTAGAFPYECAVHGPMMIGTITVQ